MADIAPDRSTTTRLALGQSLESAIDLGGDTDLIRIDLSAGQIYAFDLLGAASGFTLGDPMLTLLDANLGPIAFDDDSGVDLDARVAIIAPASGTYYLEAASFGEGAGTYRLTMASVSDDRGQVTSNAGHLVVDGSAIGTIDFIGDRDWFRIELNADTTYSFILRGASQSNGTLRDPQLALFDEAGTLVDTSDDGLDDGLDSLLSFTPLASGTYYLEASAFDNRIGSYRISAAVAGVGNEGNIEDGIGGSNNDIEEHTDLLAVNRYTGINDFDGNGHTDILWRRAGDGLFTTWQTSGNVAGDQFAANASMVGGVPTDWQIVETFDWDGDGRSDMLWRNQTTGGLTIWTGKDGGWVPNAYQGGVPTGWQIAGTGDLNGDGKDDIVWREAGGAFSTWLSTGAGFDFNAYYDTGVSTAWQIVGLADFTGDGKDDLLWRNQQTGQFTEWASTGTGFTPNTYVDTVPLNWHVDALADFDGDGKDDLLWRRDDDGAFSLWQSTGTGFTPNTYYNADVPTAWQVAMAGDFNDDGKADILWRNAQSGQFSTWQSNGGGFDANVALVGGIGSEWSIQAHDYHWG